MYIGIHERRQIEAALAEDIGGGDLSAALLPAQTRVRFAVNARQEMFFSGEGIAEAVFAALDPFAAGTVTLAYKTQDGAFAPAGSALIEGEAPARLLVTAERTILNYLRICCAVTSYARRLTALLEGTGAVLLDTRKTLPGMRGLQKQAAALGGARNHRFGLADGIMLKDNHIAAFGSVTAALQAAKASAPALTKIEAECDTLSQAAEALEAGADMIMADNMPLEQLRAVIALRNAYEAKSGIRTPVEASGNITEKNIRRVALCGPDYISSGKLTWSPPAVDIGLDVA